MNATRSPTRRHMLALAGVALAMPAVLRAAPATNSAEGPAFGSRWRVTLPDGSRLDRGPVEALLAHIDRLLSPWREDSEISAFNRAPDTAPASPETAHVMQTALALAEESGGWFDPSVGPLVHRWGFGPIEGEETGWTGLRVEGEALAKTRPGLTFDPCGIAKGRALDLLAAHLADAGHENALIDLGGELAALGRHPSGRAWQVAVEDPRPGREGVAAVLALDGLAVATSGLRAQSYDLNGQRVGHIIDPHSAAPVAGRLASVSVMADSAMLADGWATALAAAGAQGPDLARRNEIKALFLFDEGATLRQLATSGFEHYLL